MFGKSPCHIQKAPRGRPQAGGYQLHYRYPRIYGSSGAQTVSVRVSSGTASAPLVVLRRALHFLGRE